MAKAILIMDMPESCDMCDFVDDEQPPRYGEKTLYCGIAGMGEDVTDYIACRPEFCPLRELEREVGHSMLKDKNGPVYLDKLEPNRGDMNTEIMPDCGIMCYLNLK